MFRILRHVKVVDIKVEILNALLRIIMMGAHVDANNLNALVLAIKDLETANYFRYTLISSIELTKPVVLL